MNKVKYNHKTIKQHEGKYIRLTYKGGPGKHGLCGIIASSDRDGIIFNVNKSMRKEIKNIRVLYENIIDIKIPRK